MKKEMNKTCGRKAYVSPKCMTYMLDSDGRVRTDEYDDNSIANYNGLGESDPFMLATSF